MKGIFGDLFDFNHDGKMSPLESAMEMAAIHQMMDEDQAMRDAQNNINNYIDDDDEEEDEEDSYSFASEVNDISDIENWDFMDEWERKDALEEAGLNPDDYKLEVAGISEFDLDLMDDDERAEALEDAGIDPDEFDF